jgi:hypothetical protein
MPRYEGTTVRLYANEVQVGHRLVHQDAADGWIEVVDVEERAGGEIVLHFDNGDEEPYSAGDTLWRVAS